MLCFYHREKGVEMSATPEFRKAFVGRLMQACDQSSIIPAYGSGRQQTIARRLELAPEAVSKWFKGVSMPKHDTMKTLAELLEVDQSWLAFGIKPDMDRNQRRVHARTSDGAVHLVWGLITLAGGHCGEPSKTDPRFNYVDFYATMNGSVYPLHISLGREVSNNLFELLIPREYRDVRTVGVIPAGATEFHFLNLPLSMIQEHAMRKAGDYAMHVSRIDGSRYVTGGDTWPKLHSFADMG